MLKVLMAAMTALLLFLGIAGCDQQEGAGAIETQIKKVAEKAKDTALNAAEQAGNKIQQWTDQASPDEKSGEKSAKKADQQTAR
jgi:nitrous oxide reductase accessory protein NosL